LHEGQTIPNALRTSGSPNGLQALLELDNSPFTTALLQGRVAESQQQRNGERRSRRIRLTSTLVGAIFLIDVVQIHLPRSILPPKFFFSERVFLSSPVKV